MKFKDLKEAIEALREWQKRLFLEDWTIKIWLEKGESGSEVGGHVEYKSSVKIAVITLYHFDEAYEQSSVVKICDEQELVHELLHLKIDLALPYLDNIATVEAEELLKTNHQLVEQMAKSLIMAKYDIPFKWYSNLRLGE